MAYDTQILRQKALEAIAQHNLIFVEDICALIGIDKATYYRHFEKDSDIFNELTKQLEINKINLKVSLRKKWGDSDNATLQMALYKLCSTDTEHKKLQQNYIDLSTKDESLNKSVELTDEQFNEALNVLKPK